MKTEWLLIIVPVSMLLIWALWYNLTTKWYNWRYKPENDKARPGKEPSESGESENAGIRKSIANFPIAARINAGSKLEVADIIKTRQNSKSPRGFFASRRR